MHLILLLFQLLFQNIFCDSLCGACTDANHSPPDCPSGCTKSFYSRSDEYFYCPGKTSSGTYKYFYIFKYGTNNECHSIDLCPDKVIKDTFECVPDCGPYFEIGDFCYESLPNEADYIPEIVTENKKKYKCKDYTDIQLIDGSNEKRGKEFHICIKDPKTIDTSAGGEDYSDVKKCPDLYYDSNKKICDKSCEKRVIIKNTSPFLYYECRNECKYSEDADAIKEYEYNESIDIAGSKNIYCLEECPEKTPFYYKISSTISPKCRKNCEPGDFYIKDNNNNYECLSKCDDNRRLYYQKDSNDQYFFCFMENDNSNNPACPIDHPHKYQNACLKSCSETQLTIFFNKKTFLFTDDTDRNICVDDCYTHNNNYYSDEGSLLCVSSCKETNNKYHFNHKCYNSCSKTNIASLKYYIKYSLDLSSVIPDPDENDPIEYECVSSCPNGYYQYGEDICLKYCPKTSDKPFIDETLKVCTSCKVPVDPSNLQSGEGYFIDQEFTVNKGINVKCQKSCPSGYYHKNKDNKCFLISEDNNCYFPENDMSVCYTSCQEIGADYKSEKDNICYKEEVNCGTGYFYTKNKYKKCLNDNEVTSMCERLKYNYLRDKECVSDCKGTEYIIKPIETIYDGVKELGKCCQTPDCDEIYKYYSESDKILNKTCSLKTIEDEEGNEVSSPQGNCVLECPAGYYESLDGKKCKLNCGENFYYTSGTKKNCVNNCESIHRFYFEGKKECLMNCRENDEFYYYDGNICYKSCTETENNNKFSLPATNFHQKCLSECPKAFPYYYENDKICLSSCDGGFYKKTENGIICVSQCNTTEYVISNNNTCSDKCQDFVASVPLKRDSNIMINKCVNNCKNFGYNLFYYKKYTEDSIEKTLKICCNECPPGTYKNGIECLDKCPEGYFTEMNECKTECQSPYYVKNEDGKGFICVQNCDLTKYFVSLSHECVTKCGIGENFIGKNRRCKSKCEEEDGIYYKKYTEQQGTSNDQESSNSYDIFLCMNNYGSSSDEYLVYEVNEIVTKCPDTHPYLSKNGNICYSKCISDSLLPFSAEEMIEGTNGEQTVEKKCSFECKGNKLNYLKEEKICYENCDSFLTNNIINDEDKSCVEKCDQNSLYKYQTLRYEEDDENSEVVNLHCSKQCYPPTQKYLENNGNKCVKACLAPNNYEFEDKCFSKCPGGKFAKYDEDTKQYQCIDSCDRGEYYYEKNMECISRDKCTKDNGDYIIEETQICTPNCALISKSQKYYFYKPDVSESENDSTEEKYNKCVTKCPEDKPYLRENNFCEISCNEESYKYYKEEDKKCLEKCPPDAKYKDGNICRSACPADKFQDEIKLECIDSCLNSAQMKFYYTPPDNKCMDKCPNDDYYKNNYACVKSCPGDKDTDNKYVGMNNNCVKKCPENLNFVVKEFTHEKDKDRPKKCDNKCPEDYPYYIHNVVENENECVATCNYYVLPENENFKSIECFKGDKCPDNYNFYIKNDDNTVQCLRDCPTGIPYYVPEEGGKNRCYEKCPFEKPYSNYNSFICITEEECNSKIIDYDENKCVSECNSEQYWAEKNGIKYCLKKCNIELGEYLSIGKECVESCDSSKFLISDITNPLFKTCNCAYLYYVDDSGIIKCLDPQQEQCGEEGSGFESYKYRISDTNQCVKSCFGYLSPSEDICYLDKTCNEIDVNTYLVISEDKLKCDCKYRFYIDLVTKKKICLSENDECSVGSYYMYTPETKECSQECKGSYLTKFDDNKCFSQCPITPPIGGSQQCKCNNFISKISETQYKCIEDQCENDSPYKIKESKQCVKKCLGTGYEILHKNECVSSCATGMKRIEIEDDDKLKEIAKYKCQCETFWYYENGEIQCLAGSNIEKCSDIEEKEFKYIVKDTKECVNFCPDSYYYFNDECFKTCDNAKNKYHYPVKTPDANSGSKECICENLWKKIAKVDEDGNPTQTEVQCLTDIVCENLMIHETKECVDECPLDYPLEFNKQCYKRGNCPEGTEEDILNGASCICKKVWHFQDNDNKNCINSDKCPDSHPYKIFSTRECISEPCSTENGYPYILNYTCYENCPEGTVKRRDSRMCECDPEFGYWYVEDNEKQNMICGLSNCSLTGDKLLYKSNTKQCLSSCAKYELYKLNNICYENECPYPTVSENVLTNKYECTIKKYTTATNLDESYKFIKDEIVELYKSVPKGGIVYHNFQSTMQVYGVNKNNNETKDLTLRSSLSYIDISPCMDKIYENNKMKESDDIVVVKYDLEDQVAKSLVKPVEYEFINSRTGQVLDMTVCKKDDIVVSYSLSDILNYNVQAEEERLLEEKENNENDNDAEITKIILDIQKQYNKGKEIYQKYKMDAFNINSPLYNDMCFSFEIDGKDLVLEDRVKYLYPYYSLCEANCTYSYTDFELERIFCNCPLKSEFDFKREQKFVINDNNINGIRSKQKGPSNIPVMECISKLSQSQKIRNNGAFFFSLVIMLFEIGLFFLTIFYCYKILINKICKNSMEEKEKEIEKNNINNKGKEMIYKENKKIVNAPPKKRGISNKEIDPNDIKIETKIIKSEMNEINNKENDGTETEDPRLDVDDTNNDSFAKEYELGILNEIKKEEKILRIKFELAIQRDKSDIFISLLTEICDKIYLFKVLFLLGKYDMFSIYYSMYLLYHLILFTMITCFYDIKTIQDIWSKNNYPNLNFDLGYGLLASLIVWVIYRIFLCIINNDTIIKKYMSKPLTKSTNSENDDLRENNKRLNNLIRKIRNGMIAYFVIELIAVLLCLLYVTTFSAIYIGTKAKVFRTYGITLAELVIIKILYGIILGIFRKVGLYKKKKVLYKIAYYFDKYIY